MTCLVHRRDSQERILHYSTEQTKSFIRAGKELDGVFHVLSIQFVSPHTSSSFDCYLAASFGEVIDGKRLDSCHD